MNLVLFESEELFRPLPADDPRLSHVRKVLRRSPGETFEAGLVNGPRGLAELGEPGPDGSTRILFIPSHGEVPPLPPITLLVGLPRPQTARDILRDATAQGVSVIHFVHCQRSDPNYAASSLWTGGEWRRHLLAGAAQAYDTRLPHVPTPAPLAEALNMLPPPTEAPRLALDNYEAEAPLASLLPAPYHPLVLALGPERGWGVADRAMLRTAGFRLASLGKRVLRLETAVTSALALAHHHRPANNAP